MPRKKKEKPKTNDIQFSIKRSRGEGSIFQRKSDGKWVGSITIGYDDKGRQKKKVVYGNSRMEAARKLSEISGRIKSESLDMEGKTFGQLMLDWLMVFKKSTVAPRTFEGIIRSFKNHIKPFIDNMKVSEIDTFVIQKVINIMIDKDYSNKTIKKVKHILGQFFEYAIDNRWVQTNPVHKVKVKIHDRKNQTQIERYKALTPEVRNLFLEKLNRDESNFLKPFCITMMFAGLRVGEAIALKWKHFNPEAKTLKVEQSITRIPKFDSEGNVLSRVTVVGSTKTLCSIREIPIADIVVENLLKWREKQFKREVENPDVTAELISPDSFIFGNDDGSVRTYYGCRTIFERFLRRNKLTKYHIYFHGLRHTFSNMLFEMNENPKVIQQLLGHRDVKTTITVYNSVDSEYIRITTDRFNEKIKKDLLFQEQKYREREIEEKKEKLISDMSDEEYDDLLEQLLRERRERKRKQNEYEMDNEYEADDEYDKEKKIEIEME